MKIFPAIDIKDKKCVRLVKGDFKYKTEYATSPIEQAAKYKEYGFKNLHIIDLDGALTGKAINSDIIEEIVKKYDLEIEVGGGIRTKCRRERWSRAGRGTEFGWPRADTQIQSQKAEGRGSLVGQGQTREVGWRNAVKQLTL